MLTWLRVLARQDMSEMNAEKLKKFAMQTVSGKVITLVYVTQITPVIYVKLRK